MLDITIRCRLANSDMHLAAKTTPIWDLMCTRGYLGRLVTYFHRRKAMNLFNI